MDLIIHPQANCHKILWEFQNLCANPERKCSHSQTRRGFRRKGIVCSINHLYAQKVTMLRCTPKGTICCNPWHESSEIRSYTLLRSERAPWISVRNTILEAQQGQNEPVKGKNRVLTVMLARYSCIAVLCHGICNKNVWRQGNTDKLAGLLKHRELLDLSAYFASNS